MALKYPCAVSESTVASSPERSSAERTPQVVIEDAEIFEHHEGGKLSVELKEPLDTQRALSIAYTPGVAQVSRAIATDHTLAAKYTWANRLVAVVSDGTAVLGLGDIGPAASLPVMEGKSALFKSFGGLNSIPIVLDTKDPDEIVETLIRLRPTFGAVNLEDISAPRCFEIERRVIEALDCPVMHDDQHGTAIVVLAALLGATKVLERDIHALRVVISGAGAAGVACANILLNKGITDVVVLDSQGIVHSGRDNLNSLQGRAGRTHQPAQAHRRGGRGARGCRRLPRGVRRRRARGAHRHDGAQRHRLRAVQPGSRDPPGRRPQVRGGRWRPGAATSRTRSTTCWPSPACSAVRWTPVPVASPRR